MRKWSVVNKNGFCSLYVLAILPVVLCFLLYVLQVTLTWSAHLSSEESLHEAQLYAILYVKEHLHQADKEATENDAESMDGKDTEEPPEAEKVEEETLYYQQHTISISMQEDAVSITIDPLRFTLLIEDASIIDLVYEP